MVERVEGFSSELQLMNLRDKKAFIEPEIEVIKSGLSYTGTSPNTVGEGSGLDEAGFIEVLSLASRRNGIGVAYFLRKECFIRSCVRVITFGN